MNEVLCILVGLFIGAPIGWALSAITNMNSIKDLESEINDLRLQRKLLKKEIVTMRRPKPKPRRNRNG
jgi:predicted  nucleic acid-binding Zn-ribbon protein